MRSSRWGFTLIEMLVVMALAAIMATLVAVSLAGSYSTARMEDVVGKIEAFDHLVREHSRRTGSPGGLAFDLNSGVTIRSVSPDQRVESRSDASPVLSLPAGFRIVRLILAGGAA